MKRLTLRMVALAALLAGTLFAQDLTGTWQGSLGDFRMVFKISQTDNKSLTAVLYSIDEGGQPVAASAITQQGAIIKMTVDGTVYEGKLSTDGNSLAGTWTERASWPLNLGRATPATAWPIPIPHQVDVAPSEFKARRAELLKRFPDGIVLLHARADWLQWGSWAFHEDPSFYYFFGGGNYINSILALDGTSRETWLFVPTKLSGMADGIRQTPGAGSAARLGIEHVSPWEEFVPWIDRRFASNPPPVLYVDDTFDWWGKRKVGRDIPESNPPGLDPVVDAQLLWRLALERRWPKAKLKSASDGIEEMRSVKSPAEIERMRAVGKATVGAWLRGSIAIGNGDSPGQVQAEVVRGCIDNGAQGPSGWPEVNKSLGGKLLRLDMGCDLDHYQTDTCRMVPASGHFSPEQKEAWEYYVAAYRAGLAAIHDGVRRVEVFEAMKREADRRKGQLQSELARGLAAAILDPQAVSKGWIVHSQGLVTAEAEPEILREGMIVAFEPTTSAGPGQHFNIEDVTLVTKDGYEVLAPLPYDAAAIEASMRPVKR